MPKASFFSYSVPQAEGVFATPLISTNCPRFLGPGDFCLYAISRHFYLAGLYTAAYAAVILLLGVFYEKP
jgi:hypothetical protein